jgi:hypothetical protein
LSGKESSQVNAIKRDAQTCILTKSRLISISGQFQYLAHTHCQGMSYYVNFFGGLGKGQLISKANCQAVDSSKKRTNEFVFTTMRRVFIRVLEEIEDTKKPFQN